MTPDRLAVEVADIIETIGVVLATIRGLPLAGTANWVVDAIERIRYDLLDRWKAYARWPSAETQRRLEEAIARWRDFSPRRT